ncbi:MAG: hypothetical protein Ct9H300mP1_04910 [Planctomycetaceae bacterium]|nr:MAG: hypothetical protein Ct9H300mP1_04910 [Planctomycetaceae bacterium]
MGLSRHAHGVPRGEGTRVDGETVTRSKAQTAGGGSAPGLEVWSRRGGPRGERRSPRPKRQLAVLTESSLLVALFFGFCAAMLGISGFESSANFVEEQEPGSFPRR